MSVSVFVILPYTYSKNGPVAGLSSLSALNLIGFYHTRTWSSNWLAAQQTEIVNWKGVCSKRTTSSRGQKRSKYRFIT